MVTDEEFEAIKAKLDYNLVFLESRISVLEDALSAEGKKIRKKKIKETISLNDVKFDFIESNPRERTDPFNDTELALWAAYLLSETNRREVIESWSTLRIRTKIASKLVKFFADGGHEIVKARLLAREYLEMVLTQYPTFKGKDGEQNMGFFTATSDFAIGFYSQKMSNWKQIKNLPDESLD